MKNKPLDHANDGLLAKALETITARILAGEDVTEEILRQEYPDLFEQLRDLLPTISSMQQWASFGETVEETEACLDDDSKPLGDFKIVQELGRGGMGIVYEAEQMSLGRRVAVKVLPFAALISPSQLERFKNEARAAAMLKHPNIASVHAVGCERGVHYYAMELIDGRTLAEIIKSIEFPTRPQTQHSVKPDRNEQDTTPKARLSTAYATDRAGFYKSVARIGVEAAEALDFAHNRGIVHRDIKPSNLLLDHTGTAHITDFGLALIDSSSKVTLTGDVIGTLRYMSPEQLEEASTVDGRTDVYSLGATLYETLCGRHAVDGEKRADLLRSIVNAEPRDLNKVDSGIPDDLATVVMKCLGKSPLDRYQSARELADDLQRFVDDRAVIARKTSMWKSSWRWAQKHKTFSATATIALVALLILSIAGPIVAFKLRGALRNEQQLSRQLRMHNYDMRIRDAAHAVEAANYRRAEEGLRSCDDSFKQFEWFYLWNRIQEDRRRTITHQGIDVMRLAMSPDGKKLATANWFGLVTIYDRATQEPIASFRLREFVPLALEFSPDGKVLFAGAGNDATLWDVENARILKSWAPKFDICSADFSPDGRLLAIGFMEYLLSLENQTADPSCIHLIDISRVANAKQETLEPPQSRQIHELLGSISGLAFAPDGHSIVASTNASNTIRRWNPTTFEELQPIVIDDVSVQGICFHPKDANILAVASGVRGRADDRSAIALYSVDRGTLTQKVHSITSQLTSISFSSDGHRLAVGTDDGRLLTWDATKQSTMEKGIPDTVRAHQGAIYDIEFSNAGTTLVSAGSDGFVREQGTRKTPLTLPGHDPSAGGVEFLSNNRVVTWGYGTESNTLKLWQLSDRSLVQKLDTGDFAVTDTVPLPSNQEIAYCANTLEKHTEVGIWDLAAQRRRRLFSKQGVKIRDLALSLDGTKLIAGARHDGFKNHLIVIDVLDGKYETQSEFDSYSTVAIAREPNSDLIAIGGEYRSKSRISFWDIRRKACVRQLDCGTHPIWSLAFSREGYLAAGTMGSVLLWKNWKENSDFEKLTGHSQNAYCVRFSHDGSRLASAGLDGTVRLWNTNTGNELLLFKTAASWNYRVAFSPDDQLLAYAGWKGTAFGQIYLVSAASVENTEP